MILQTIRSIRYTLSFAVALAAGAVAAQEATSEPPDIALPELPLIDRPEVWKPVTGDLRAFAQTSAVKSPTKVATIDGTHSGSWYNREQTGHGFSIHVVPDNRMVVYWFTYDSAGEPLFLTGTGSITDSRAVVDLSYFEGMPFGLFYNDDVRQHHWGTVQIEFFGCDTGWVYYHSDFVDRHGSPFGLGALRIDRLTSIQGSECQEDSAEANQETYLRIANDLLQPINVYIDGEPLGSVPPDSVAGEHVTFAEPLEVTWELVRPNFSEPDTPLGEQINVEVFRVRKATETTDVQVDAVLADGSRIFAPIVNNPTDGELLMGINMGTADENRCNCIIEPRARDISIGYYWLTDRSNVRAYDPFWGYSGPFLSWGFSSAVEASPVPGLRRIDPPSGELFLNDR